MTVKEALNARHSIRAYLPTPVEPDKLNRIFEAAARTPSWGNSQPWEVYVASGAALDRIKATFKQKYAEKAHSEPEIPHPKGWPQSVVERQRQLYPDMVRDCGEAVKQFGPLNQTLYNAPTVIYICMDKLLNEWSLYDVGAYSQSFMLAAEEEGLSTIPAIMLLMYPDVVRRELQIPDNMRLTIGIAVGYKDPDNKINNFNSSRSPLTETIHYCK